MVLRLLAIIVALFSAHSIAQQCPDGQGFAYSPFAYNFDKPAYLQNGKTKSSTSGLAWLSKYMLPVPKYAYDADKVAYHTDLQNNLDLFLWDVDWWKWYLECVPDQQIYTQLDLGYCNTTLYDNNTCEGNQWVGLPGWIADDLNAWGGYSFGDANESFSRWGTWFMEQANSSKPPSVQNELDKQRQNVSEQATTAYYGIIGDYLGVGFPVSCKQNIADTLAAADAFDSAGWQAATTLMALIPVLLTFGNLYVARSSEAFGTSFLVGTMSAVFSLGLPVRSISGIREKQRVTISQFAFYARQSIAVFGKPCKRSHDTGDHRSAACPARLEDLQKWSTEPPKDTANIFLSEEQEASDCSFGDIRRRALKWQKRAHMWHVSALLVSVMQGVLFLFSIGPLFVGFGTPLLLFDCKNYWTSLWLIVSAGISALFRLVMWETGAHEQVKIFALSSKSKSSLRDLVDDSRTCTKDGNFLLNTTETQLPPLHPAILTSVGHSLYRIWSDWVARLRRRSQPISHRPSYRHESLDADYEGMRQSPDNLRDELAATSSRDRIHLEIQVLWTTIWAAVRSPLRFLMTGYSRKSKSTAPMRYRPLLILMHLSTEGRNPLITLFTGAIEGVILIILTVFFGASWGGNLLVLCYVMGVLLIAITAGRALGLWYVVRSARIFGLHIVETQSPRQIIGCLRIICSMKDVLVFVNSGWFYEGHRLDERKGWAKWKLNYERGEYDEDIPSSPISGSTGRVTSAVSNYPPKVSVGSQHDDGSTEVVSPMGSIRLPRRSTDRTPPSDEESGMAVLYAPNTERMTTTSTPQRSTSQTSNSSLRRPPFQYQRTTSPQTPLEEPQSHSSQ